jgi:hypothetical protein
LHVFHTFAYFRNYGTALQKITLKHKIIEDEIGVTRSMHYVNSFKILVVKPEGKRRSLREEAISKGRRENTVK